MDRLKSKGMDRLNKIVWIDSRRHWTVHTVYEKIRYLKQGVSTHSYLGQTINMPWGVLMTDILPSLMAFDLQRLLLMMVCKGNFRLAEAMAPRLTPMGGCGVLTVDLTVILSLPIGQGIGRPAPLKRI